MTEKINTMQSLISQINKANDAYYNTGVELISNKEWDELYDKLMQLEQETGVILSNSPTQNVGYEVASKLQKETHDVPALSLDKTKEISQLVKFIGNQEGILSWKLDGLTVVLTYENGILTKAITRGNGMVGEVITNNAKNFANIPLTISDKQKLTIRGEALIMYEDFNRINENLPEGEDKYKNPRNLCSGSVRQLDPKETKRRNVHFKAFTLVTSGSSFIKRSQQLDYLKQLGFDVVDYVLVTNSSLEQQVETFEEHISENPFPSDGLVLQYNDIAYGESLGTTSKFPRDSIAFKWEDEVVETILKNLEWNASRTGLINPIAVFEPIDLVGTTVQRASVHNVSIVKGLSLVPGDTITVYKANMIIPQIAENLTKSGVPEIPSVCPVCGKPTTVRTLAGEAETLWCLNPNCGAKQIGLFVHAVGRDALNIEDLSEKTIRRFMDNGYLSSLPDLFQLKDYEVEIISMDGFGQKSFDNLMESIERARHTDLQKLIYTLGIENVGRTASKAICKHFGYDVVRTVNASKEELKAIPDIGDTIAVSFTEWFKNQNNQELFEDLLSEVQLEIPQVTVSQTSIAGKTFVITGAVNHFKNRDEAKAKIEELGGKVSGSVSSKTNYLINNDITSTSGKNKKAKELGIPIITEDELLNMMKG